jgi:hypothetical protein
MEEKIRLRIEDLVFDTFETSAGESGAAGTVFANATQDTCAATEQPQYGCVTDPDMCLYGTGCGIYGSTGGPPPSQVCVTNRQVSCDGTCPGWCDPTSVCGTTGGGGTGSLYCGPEPTQGPDHTCASCV